MVTGKLNIGTSPVKIFSANKRRLWFEILNCANEDVYIVKSENTEYEMQRIPIGATSSKRVIDYTGDVYVYASGATTIDVFDSISRKAGGAT